MEKTLHRRLLWPRAVPAAFRVPLERRPGKRSGAPPPVPRPAPGRSRAATEGRERARGVPRPAPSPGPRGAVKGGRERRREGAASSGAAREGGGRRRLTRGPRSTRPSFACGRLGGRGLPLRTGSAGRAHSSPQSRAPQRWKTAGAQPTTSEAPPLLRRPEPEVESPSLAPVDPWGRTPAPPPRSQAPLSYPTPARPWTYGRPAAGPGPPSP